MEFRLLKGLGYLGDWSLDGFRVSVTLGIGV